MMSETSAKPADISAMVGKSSAATVEPVERTLERFLEIATVKSVYASPMQHGEKMIIPAAEVLNVWFWDGRGYGYGRGLAECWDGKKMTNVPRSRSCQRRRATWRGRWWRRRACLARGGGHHLSTRRREVEPVMDTKIALAFFTALGFMIGMARRMPFSVAEE
jgi:hypothetical protein